MLYYSPMKKIKTIKAKLNNNKKFKKEVVFYRLSVVILFFIFAILFLYQPQGIKIRNKDNTADVTPNLQKTKTEVVSEKEFERLVEEELKKILETSPKPNVNKNKSLLNVISKNLDVEPPDNISSGFSGKSYQSNDALPDILKEANPTNKLNYISYEKFNEWKKNKEINLDEDTIEFSNNSIKEAKKEEERQDIIQKIKNKNSMTVVLPSFVPKDNIKKEKSINNLAGYISRKYQLNFSYAQKITQISFDTANSYSLDPKLVLAFIAEQSGFNPISGSTSGGLGLTQIVPRWFNINKDLLSDPDENNNSVINIENNIVVGVSVFKNLMEENNNSIKKALMIFNKVDLKTSKELESIVNNNYLKFKQVEDGKIQPVNN